MLYLRSWLEEYIDLTGISDEFLSDLLSLKSGEVEEVLKLTDWFDDKVKVAEVRNLREHPSADKLKIFDAYLGRYGSVQIVTGAPNIYEGMLTPVATVGTKLAYLTITERSLRGQQSFGMALGKSELMLETEYSSGLWDLAKDKNPSEYNPGDSICEAFREFFPSQSIFEIKYLQDKFGTLSCHLALAIELAYCLDDKSRLKPKATRILNPKQLQNEFQELLLKSNYNHFSKGNFEDKVEYTNVFSLYTLELFADFILPKELQQRLFFTGKNIVGNIADLSNYLLFDVGQPSHFFSPKSLSYNWKIEKLQTDQKFEGLGQLKNVELTAKNTVLYDNEDLLWIPGISGNTKNAVSQNDLEIGIELANFDLESVARNSFSLNYRSDSSRFWSSGVNPAVLAVWILHFLEILHQNNIKFNFVSNLLWINQTHHKFHGNEINTENLISFGHGLISYGKSNNIDLDLDFLAGLYSKEFSVSSLASSIEKLGSLENGKFIPISVYSNFQTQEDVLFEAVKYFGLDNLPYEYPNLAVNQKTSKWFWNEYQLKSIFVEYGFIELVSRLLVKHSRLLSNLTAKEDASLTALSTHRQDENRVQDSLIPNLLDKLSDNLAKGEKEIRLFEKNKIYHLNGTRLIETSLLEAVCLEDDPYIFTSLLRDLNSKTSDSELKVSQVNLDLGQGYQYHFESGLVAELIELSNKFKKDFAIPINRKVFILSLKLDDWNWQIHTYPRYMDDTDFPTLNRSYSFVVPNKLRFTEIKEFLISERLKDLKMLIFPQERFANSEDQDVINFDIKFSSDIKTLTTEEIESWENIVIDELSAKYPGTKNRNQI